MARPARSTYRTVPHWEVKRQKSPERFLTAGYLIPLAVVMAVVMVLLRNTASLARNLAIQPVAQVTASTSVSTRLPVVSARYPTHSSTPLSAPLTTHHAIPQIEGQLSEEISRRAAQVFLSLGAFGVACMAAVAAIRQHFSRPSQTSLLASGMVAISLPEEQHMSMAATSGRTVTALCPVADGSEDIEFTTVTDVLVRAGVKVVTASVMPSKEVKLARGIRVTADVSINDVSAKDFDLVVCAGGLPGAEHFRDSKTLNDIVVEMKKEGKLIAAICATPCVMFANNPDIMEGLQRVTSYPAFHAKLRELYPNVAVSEDAVVVDGNCVTSQGPGTSMAFALKVAELAVGWETAKEVAKGMLYQI